MCIAGGTVVEYTDGVFSAASIWKHCLAVIFGDSGKRNCFPGGMLHFRCFGEF